MKSTLSVCSALLLFAIISPPLHSQATALPAVAPKTVALKSDNDQFKILQADAIRFNKSELGYWGNEPDNYKAWGTHSNRLIPIYTFGTKNAGTKNATSADGTPNQFDLTQYTGEKSVYRNEKRLKDLYGRTPTNTLNPQAEYCDQTDIAEIQFEALKVGKKHIFLVVFDGMDWQSARLASIAKTNQIAYKKGRGQGLHFQDYQANGTSQFGFMVTASHNAGTSTNVDKQTATLKPIPLWGGYNATKGGATPWTDGNDNWYPMGLTAEKETTKKNTEGKHKKGDHSYPDSAATATSMNTGIKTYNASINVDPQGIPVYGIAHSAQKKQYAIGVVTSVPISHATPACTYANNVSRNDYQDLTRDLLGLKSIAHPKKALQGVDVLIGFGYGGEPKKKKDILKAQKNQGKNYVAGNNYLTDADRSSLKKQYSVAVRTAGVNGGTLVKTTAKVAAQNKKRLFGFFGTRKGASSYNGTHAPFQTANGDFQPTQGRRAAEKYTPEDLYENPNLKEMTEAALIVLQENKNGFWLMVEAGDVDWANHDNNFDNSVGAVLSGDAAVKAITDWVEKNSNWEESLMIITADHGHYFRLKKPELLLKK